MWVVKTDHLYLFYMKHNYQHKVKRDEQKSSGVFDGRFRQRVVVDKKKQSKRDWARQKQYI